jgi:two-component system NtrC family response regulator
VKPKILLVDDEEAILEQMRWAFASDYDVFTASIEAEAMCIYEKERPPVVTLDLSLDPHNPTDLGGMRLLEQILSRDPSTRAIVLTGHNDDSSALRAMRLGAFDYYTKPVRLDELKVMIKRGFHLHQLLRKAQQFDHTLRSDFHGVVGASKAMKELLRAIDRIALSDVPLLISGESGTGKEILAHAIHLQSQRKNNPFVVVSCGAIPEHLLESELFGHEKGALSGAHARKRGKLELAHTGTLFLDEIGGLALPLQVKLLRFLQDRKIERVGGTLPIESNTRLIAATNQDLKEAMVHHGFREDLYYRLNVVRLDLPPLRERQEDIVPLAQHFLKKFCKEYGKPLLALSPQAEAALLMHPWPGNVRELENLISRSVMLSSRAVLQPPDLGFATEPASTDVNLKLAKRAIEMDFVKKALSRNRGVVSRAARELGISRVNLYELIEKCNIRLQEFKISRATEKSQMKTREVS